MRARGCRRGAVWIACCALLLGCASTAERDDEFASLSERAPTGVSAVGVLAGGASSWIGHLQSVEFNLAELVLGDLMKDLNWTLADVSAALDAEIAPIGVVCVTATRDEWALCHRRVRGLGKLESLVADVRRTLVKVPFGVHFGQDIDGVEMQGLAHLPDEATDIVWWHVGATTVAIGSSPEFVAAVVGAQAWREAVAFAATEWMQRSAPGAAGVAWTLRDDPAGSFPTPRPFDVADLRRWFGEWLLTGAIGGRATR